MPVFSRSIVWHADALNALTEQQQFRNCSCHNNVITHLFWKKLEPQHEKTNKMTCPPSASAQIDPSLRCPHEETLGSRWAHCKDSDQSGWMLRLIWVFACCTGDFVGISEMHEGCCYIHLLLRQLLKSSKKESFTILPGLWPCQPCFPIQKLFIVTHVKWPYFLVTVTNFLLKKMLSYMLCH